MEEPSTDTLMFNDYTKSVSNYFPNDLYCVIVCSVRRKFLPDTLPIASKSHLNRLFHHICTLIHTHTRTNPHTHPYSRVGIVVWYISRMLYAYCVPQSSDYNICKKNPSNGGNLHTECTMNFHIHFFLSIASPICHPQAERLDGARPFSIVSHLLSLRTQSELVLLICKKRNNEKNGEKKGKQKKN